MKARSARKRHAVVEEIEPRILYAADFAPALADAAAFVPEAEQRLVEPSGEFTETGIQETRQHEIVFVDSATPDYSKLIEDIRSHNGERDIEVVLLDGGKDGIEQITKTLSGREGITAVHIVSHGSDGGVQLGKSNLNFDALLKNASNIKKWGNALTGEADILIYGCDVAASQDGKSLIEALSRLTGADVAASDDLTGGAELGGDWNLEFHAGDVETSIVFSQSMVLDWNATLQGVAVGGETRANTTTSGTQDTSTWAPPRVVAMDANGNYVVAWSGEGPGDTNGVFFQRYNANGAAQGVETRINAVTADTQDMPAVAMDASGNFVVAWRSNNQDGSGTGIYAQRYDASGGTQGSQFRVNTTTANGQDNPIVAMNASGAFVVAWVSINQDGDAAGVYAKRYDSAGVAQSGEIAVNTTTAGNQWVDSVAMDATGNFVVTFNSADPNGSGVWTRRFDSSGSALSGAVRANTTTTGDQDWSSVAMAPDGDYVVAWRSVGQDGSLGGIYAQRYDSAGVAQGSEFRVNTTTADDQQHPAVAMDVNGNFMVVWASYDQDAAGTWGIYKQEYNADGTANGGQVRVNSTLGGNQMNPALAMNAVGQAVVAWAGNGSTDSSGVYFQRYSTALIVDTTSQSYDSPVTSGTITISQLLSNKGGDGRISLREAIFAANNTANANANSPDRIYFNIPGGGVRTINLASQLPFITRSVIIDGTTQRGYAGMPLVEVDGQGTIAEGLYLDTGSDGSTIKGLILNRFQWAIDIDGSSNNVVTGNFLGTDATGTVAKGNWVGVWVGTSNNRIGGTTAADRNIISGNTIDGVQISGAAGGTGNVVLGNYIGLDVTGTADLGNTNQGIALYNGAKDNIIGGTVDGAGNVISGNNGEGVRLIHSGTTGNVVLGNFIGTNAAGTAAIANTRHGVWIEDAAANNTIGGMATDAGNTIAYNTLDGVSLSSTAGSGNSVLGNAIFSNGGLAIDLSDNGVTANNGTKTAATPNLLMDFPVIQSAVLTGTTLTVSGYVGAAPNDTDFAGARIEFFRSPDAAGANGEADVYLGFLTADASGNFSGTLTVSSLAVGNRITATATDTSSNTSEFGVNATVASAAPAASNDAYAVNEDSTLAVGWWDTDWTRRRQVTFTGNNFGGATNLTDFPVLIELNSGNVDYAQTQSQGEDLRFLDANGASLAYQIESWNESGTSYVWVKVPQVDAGSSDYIWMYYGNAAAAAGQNPTAVWTGGFSAVYHLNDSGTSIDDASASNFDGTAVNGAAATSAGQVAGARSFDGTDDYINLGANRAFVNNATAVTVSAWINTSTIAGSSVILGATTATGGAAGTSRIALERAGADLRILARSDDATSTNVVTTTAPLAAGAWRYVTAVVDASANTMSIYVDGVVQTTTGTPNLPDTKFPGTNSQASTLGADESGGPGRVQGRLDEVRWSTVGRSAAWVRAEHLSMTGGFVSVGAAQTVGATQGVLGNDSDPNGDSITAVLVSGPANAASFSLNVDGTFSYTPSTNFSGTDTFTYRANDGTNNSNIATVTITVNPVNDSPANTAPGTQTVNEDTGLVFSSGNGNRISIADVDAASGAMQVTLTAANGALTLGSLSGLTFSTGDGTADATMTLTGSLADVNTALNGLGFAPTANFNGNTSVTITTSDLGNTGSGGTLTDTDTVSITVNAIDDAIGAVSDTNAAANTVAENAAVGALAGITAAATDPDTTDTVTYSLDDSAGGRFAIHSATGVVTVAGALDRESAASHNVTVRATSSGGGFSTRVFTVTLTDVDEFNVGAVSDSDAAANNVAENAAMGTLVHITASASDADATNNAISYSLDDNAGGRFAINASSGVVTVAGALDYESASSYGITVRATSTDGSSNTAAFTISLTDVDEFNVGAISDINPAANSVAEDAIAGAFVGITASASDADGTSNAITYTLDDNAGGRFAIDASSGVVTVAAGLDRESAPSHGIVVRATSTDGSFNTQAFTISLTDVDESDVGAIGDINAAADSVAENAGIGTAVGITAFASDADATNNAIAYSLDDNAGGLFAIDASSGLVTVAGALDYESATSHSILVRATSVDGSSITQGFTISLTDVDESDVGAISDSDPAADSVAENAGIGTAVGITAFSSDADATNNTITYSLDNNAGGRFAIDASSGVVTVAGALDRESAASHSIVVRASSADGSSIAQGFTISLTDVDESDVGAIGDNDAAADSVAEDAGIGSAVGITASASDPDATNSTIAFSLDDNAGGRFAIDASSGVVTVAAALDAETATSHNITVRATSADGSSNTQVFSIAVADVDEFAVGAISDVDAAVDAVNENAATGTVVGLTASALDADATNNSVTYTLMDDAGGLFAIDSVTGVVTVAGAIDAEAASAYTITVEAASSDGSVTSENFVIAVSDVDEFDIGPISDINLLSDAVYEDAGVGATVGIVAAATDDDATTYDITYALDNDAGGRFAIDAVTGEVTVAWALDHESATSHGIVVRATSADGSSRTQGFTIGVADVDEFGVGAIGDTDAAADSVAESAGIGSAVGITAFASDADASNNAITYSLDDDAAGRFAIDASSGVVTVAGTLDRESASSHGIVVRATSDDGSFNTQAVTISLTDVDELDVGPISDTDAAANGVTESAVVGTLVGITASATDADATSNTITYSLDDSAGGRFAINASSGVVTVAGALDAETALSHGIVVRATSADGSSSTQGFTIAVGDVNEFGVGPIADSNVAANSVAEDAAPGTLALITALASDADASTDAIAYSLDVDAGGRFIIDANTGVVTVVGALDAETAASHNVVVRATSADGSFSTQAFTISLANVNEAPVVNNQVFGGAENSANASVFGSISFSDQDVADTATYTITAGNLGGAFAIDASGRLLVADSAALDFETTPSFSLTVEVRDGAGLTDTATVTVNLSGVNEGPALTSNTLSVTQGGSVTVSSASIAASDVDTLAGLLVFTASNVTNGHFELAGAPGVPVATFTQAHVDSGQVRFVHDGGSIAPTYELSVSDGSLSAGPLAASISFGPPPALVVAPVPTLPPSEPPVEPVPPSEPEVTADPAPGAAETPVVADAPARLIPAVFSPGRVESPEPQLNDYQPQLVKPGRPIQPVATLNPSTPGPGIEPTFEVLPAATPASLEYQPTTPADWNAQAAFPQGEDPARDRIDVLLEQVQVGGMVLSVGVVWWASRISGLVGTLLASTPAWRHIDPLPVLARDDDEEKTWYDPEDRDADANELAVALVLEGARAGSDEKKA
jgi:hypothetical protein